MHEVALNCGLLLAVVIGTGGAPIQAGESGVAPRWEYRVLTKDQVLDLGQKDLAAGLNRLGHDGWELAAVDGAYIFKRRRGLHVASAENIKERLALAETDVAARKERAAWSERMARMGFMSKSRVEAEKALLAQAEIDAAQLRRDLDMMLLPAPKSVPPPKQ